MTPRSAALFILVVAVTTAACAGPGAYPRRPAPESLPASSPLLSETLGETDAWLRHYVMEGKPDSALLLLAPESPVRPRDELVWRLQRAVVLHQAEKWEESNAELEAAETLAEQRWSLSATQHLGTLLAGDFTVDYAPPPPELAMIPYYRMLNYMALGSADETLVEARKAGAYLTRLADGRDGRAPCVGEGFVQYLAGLVYRGAGESSDAVVSYRQAEAAFDACAGRDQAERPEWLGADLRLAAMEAGLREVADSAAARYRLASMADEGDAAELVVLVEHGWVAHRAHADVHVPIWDDDLKDVDGSDASVAEAAGRIGARLAENLSDQAYWGEGRDEHPLVQLAAAADGAYVLKLAWPVYRLEAGAPPRVRVRVDSLPAEPPVAADVSAALLRRWEAQRPGAITRMVGRGITKYLATRALERRAGKEGGDEARWVVGRLANLAGNALERADTRSWSLLPDRISVARFTLPPGEHAVTLEVLDSAGEVTREIELGPVTLAPRGTLVLSRRVWGDEMGDARRFGREAAPARQAAAPAN
jgi:uncharacterized protein